MKQKRIIPITLLSSLLLITTLFTGCINTETTDKIGVLVTIVPQIKMVENIGGSYTDVTVMVPAGQSPHSFEPTPFQMMQVAQASVYFTVGSGVEFEEVYLTTIQEQNSNLMLYDCSENITVISFDEHYNAEHNQTNEGEDEHNHEGTDPHIWTSPENFKKMATVVYNGLTDIDPAHQEEYYSNYQTYIAKINELHTNISTLLTPYKGQYFMVYHPAWGYFGDTYQLQMIAIEDEGKQPGPAGISAIINQARAKNITVIFVAPEFDTSSAETIAIEIDGTVSYADPLMSNYIKTLETLAQNIVSGFQ